MNRTTSRVTMFLLGASLTALAAVMPWRLMVFTGQVLMARPGVTITSPLSTTGYWPAMQLSLQLAARGWDVDYIPLREHGLLGLTIPKEHEIHVDDRLAWDDRYKVLVHEAAHTLQPFWYDKAQEEVFAESVAALLDPHGMHDHAMYLADNKGTFVMSMLFEWPAIYAAAALLR